MKKTIKFFQCYKMSARHEFNFGVAFSVGKDYFFLGIDAWFFDWNISVSIGTLPENY